MRKSTCLRWNKHLANFMCLHSQAKDHLIHEYCTKTMLHQQIWDKLCCRFRFQSQNFFFKIAQDFLIETQKAPIKRGKSDKLDYLQIKDQGAALPQQGAQVPLLAGEWRAHMTRRVAEREKEAFQRGKMEATHMEKVFPTPVTDKGLISRTYKEVPSIKRQTIL